MSRLKFKRRRGNSLVEMIAALVIMGFLMATMNRVTMVRMADQKAVDAQYSVLSADAYMADIYADFHSCVNFTVETTASGNLLLTFKQLEGDIDIYGFYPDAGECRKNGVSQFPAQRMVVQGAGNGLVVSIKLPDERLLEMSIFK